MSLNMQYHVKVQFLNISKAILLLTIVWIVSIVLKYLSALNVNDGNYRPPIIASYSEQYNIGLNQVASESTESSQKWQPTLNFVQGLAANANSSTCAASEMCQENEFQIYVHSGNENKVYPLLCLDGKQVLGESLNNCGRGINVVVIDNITKTVLRVSNYDTYEKDSIALETLILTLRKGDIAIFLTFDESVTKLSYVAKLLLHEIGSALIQNIQYRSMWFMTTQKGINGYTPYEELNLGGEGNWGKPIEFSGCIPFHIQGLPVRPDKPLVNNPKRKAFCQKYGYLWTLFCEERVVNEQLLPSKILSRLPISPHISKTPIIVLTGNEHNEHVSLTFETIVRQGGLTPSNVIVFFDATCCSSIEHLSELFGFMSQQIDYSVQNLLVDIQLTVKSIFREAKQLIILDCHVLLAADFYSYFGQLLPLLHYPNSSLAAISAYNENSLTNITSNNRAVFRSNTDKYPPKLAIMLKRDILLTSSMTKSVFWSFASPSFVRESTLRADADIVIPEISRAYFMAPVNYLNLTNLDTIAMSNYVGSDINVNLEPEVTLEGLNDLITAEMYNRKLVSLIHESNQYTNLAAFVESENLDSLKTSVTFVCQETSQCDIFCDYLGIERCVPHLHVPGVGQVLRITHKTSTGDIFIVKRT